MSKIKNKIKTLFEKEPPLTGGDSFETKIELEQQEQKMKSNIPVFTKEYKNIVDDIFTPLRYEEFRLLLFQANYFCNIFPIYSQSVKLTNAISIAKHTAFLYGISAIYKVGNVFIPCYIKTSKKSITGTFIELELSLASDVFSSYGEIDDLPITFKLKQKDIEKDVVFMKWDTLALGAYYIFLPFIKLQANLLDMLTTEGFSLIKKLNYQASSQKVIRDEMTNFFNPKSPFNISTFIGDEMKSRFKVLKLNEDDKNSFLQYFEFTMNTYYSLLGRRFNIDMKAERNVSGEIEASQSNFDILEAGHVIQMKNFIKDFENKYGIKIEEFRDENEQDSNKANKV